MEMMPLILIYIFLRIPPEDISLEDNMKKAVHPNSIEAYYSINLSRRQKEVMDIFERHPYDNFTDREILAYMGGDQDMNRVRPRISELVNDLKVLTETGSKRCIKTGIKVRTVAYIPVPQGELF